MLSSSSSATVRACLPRAGAAAARAAFDDGGLDLLRGRGGCAAEMSCDSEWLCDPEAPDFQYAAKALSLRRNKMIGYSPLPIP
jgi:hypothetical protein